MPQLAVVLSAFAGTLGIVKLSFRSLAVGFGGGFLLRSTTLPINFADLLVPSIFAALLPDTDTLISTIPGVGGVCHFNQTSSEPPLGMTTSLIFLYPFAFNGNEAVFFSGFL